MNTANSKRLFHFEARSHFLEIEIERFSSSLAIFKSHLLSSLYGLLRLAIVRPDRSNWSICSDASPFQTDLLSIMCSVFSTRAFHIWKRLIENLFHSVSHSHFSFLLSLLVLSDGATRLAIQKIGVSHRCLFVILFYFFFTFCFQYISFFVLEFKTWIMTSICQYLFFSNASYSRTEFQPITSYFCSLINALNWST